MERLIHLLASRKTTLVLVALATALAIHVIAQISENWRLDLTEDQLYSLSPGSRALLQRMQQEGTQPIDLKLYFSATTGKSLPRFIKDFITYERYLRSLLGEYEVASAGKLRVQFIDPIPDSDEAQDALDFGLEGKPINQDGDLFFFGLVLQTQTGSRDKIEFLWPNQQETIEYELAKRLHKLLWPAKQRIAVLSSLEVLSSADNPYVAQILAAQGKNPRDSWLALKLLGESYEVSQLEDVDHIAPEDYDLVLVIHPKNLSVRALWALDEWVQTGGNTMILVDPYAIDDQPPQNPQQPWLAYQYKPASNLAQLFEVWGLRRPEDRVAADFDLAMTRAVSRRGPAERLLVDLQITDPTRKEALATAHPMFQGLNQLRFFLAGSLEPTETAVPGLTLTPLIQTTAKGNTLEMAAGFPTGASLVFSDVNDPGKLREHFTPGQKPVVLAYQLQGQFPTAFPGGADLPTATPQPPPGLPPGFEMPPSEGGERIHKPAVAAEARRPATVLVFADVDWISDQVAFQSTPLGVLATNDNHRVFHNAVDYLFGSNELMAVRAKKSIHRPFTRFDEIEAQADLATVEREKQLRQDVERFQKELQDKQGSLGASNAALFEKQVKDEVDALNAKIKAANAELREIRKTKRTALAGEENLVRFSTLWTMPTLVLALGLFLGFRRQARDRKARRMVP